MPTTYEGREDQHDLGTGHSFVWLQNSAGQTVGLIEHHPKGPDALPGALYCGGYVAWVPEAEQAVPTAWKANHHLVAGGPGDEEHLTLSPSLACRHCPSHGFIRDGRWVDA
ncbi:MAG TPA: DUF6527 family protein [Pseudonocardiaceae bacterium]|jgi:hypothetical protein|nr:DUF6527 family protein [Pseudonocardiaceae bacterium]